MSKKLLDSSSSSSEDENEESGFKINDDYAKVFNKYREKEEFQRLKAKYGEEAATSKLNEAQESDDSSSEEEDEDAEKWTDEHEKDFFKTLANLKRKDAKIYDGTTSFFQEIEMGEKSSKKSDKPMTLVDLEREVITEKGGEFDELADEKLAQQLQDKTYVQEMSEIQKSLKSMVDEDQDDFLTKKVKNATEVEKDEEDYRSWLLGQKDHLQSSETESDLKTLKDYWTDKNLDSGEKFLRDYILNKRYLEGEEEEIEDAEDLSDDEKTLEQQAEFEHKYNFRFEDPDKDFIKRYPRTIQDSMRRKDESRKQKREEVKERKQKEKEKKREELMQLKSLKRKEILEKIEKLRKITGNDELAFKDEDLEEDFDPEKYDQRMAEIFDQFDNAPIEAEDEEKPVFSDLDSDLEPENWDEYGDEMQGEINLDEENAEDENVEEGDNRKNLEKELIENSKGRKKSKKRKSKFAEALEREKPTFDPNANANFEEYLDEYYKLDYEDVIGDLPCRFKYRKVPANDLGLSVEEVLSAPDRELNAWASLKKTCQYRSEEEEKKDIEEFSKKKGNINLKKKILPSLFAENPEGELEAEQSKKASKGKKRRRKSKAKGGNSDIDLSVIEGKKTSQQPKNKRRKVENKNKIDINKDLLMSDTRLQHYGINPNKYKRKVRKQKYKNK